MPSSFIAARRAFSLLLAIPPPKSNINPVSLAFSTNLCWVGIVSLGSRAGGPTYVVFAYMIHPSQELVLATCTTCSKESLSARVTNRFRFVRKCITITMISSFSSHRWGTLFKKFVKCKSNIRRPITNTMVKIHIPYSQILRESLSARVTLKI